LKPDGDRIPDTVEPDSGHPGVPGSARFQLTGWYSATKVTASEVYVNSKSPAEVARLVFHEALHNTLHLADAALHQQGGFAGSPVAQTQTKNDVSLMKRGMQHSYPQWIGGFEASNDPLNGL
jgi:hypothetical protein